MNMSLQHNILAMNSNRMTNITVGSRAKSTEKLASGYRINRAADDAAGLAISEKMRRQVKGLTQGVANTKAGVSMCQVADGALDEVHGILQRMNQLSIQAVNGTLNEEDRGYIQQEMRGLIAEIDRISNDTTFNEVPIFRGEDITQAYPDGSVDTDDTLNIRDFKMADVSIGYQPFTQGDTMGTLRLQAIIDNPSLAANGTTYNLVYGSGNTSYPSLAVGGDVISLSNKVPTSFSHADGSNTWTRTYDYQDPSKGIDITYSQTIEVDQANKQYIISGQVRNNGGTYNGDVDVIFHADTAYNNNDTCEGYFVDGDRITTTRIYTKDANVLNVSDSNIITNMISDFSIVDQQNALAFSEKVSFLPDSKPEELSIGYYYENHNWDSLQHATGLINKSAIQADLGFAALWRGHATSGASGNVLSYRFNYGITSSETDTNIPGVTRSTNEVSSHSDKKHVYIQSGAEAGDGIWLEFGEMNSRILGLSGVDVTTPDNAATAIGSVKNALGGVSNIRSVIGAQQNRLEHTIDNENNIIENTAAAESQIRDTDMAEEMVRYSNLGILEQAGMSMLAQANQTKQNVLSLLRE